MPNMGLGIMVRKDRFPSANIVRKGEYTVWVRLPGSPLDAYICAAYVPVYARLKMNALQEIVAGCDEFREKGVVLVGGDLNVRCGCNGDPVTNSHGNAVLKLCAENDLCLANKLEDRCSGEFSRVQDVLIGGVTHTRRTTLDYVLVPVEHEPRILELTIDTEFEQQGLVSDHRPVQLLARWTHGAAQKVQKRPGRVRWRLSAMTPQVRRDFMGHCESAMTKMALAAPPASCPLPAWTDALLSSATNVIGRKRVFPNSKPWFNDAEVQALHDEKRRAGVAVRSVPVHERDAAKVRLCSLTA